jgi:hypothetical protein
MSTALTGAAAQPGAAAAAEADAAAAAAAAAEAEAEAEAGVAATSQERSAGATVAAIAVARGAVAEVTAPLKPLTPKPEATSQLHGMQPLRVRWRRPHRKRGPLGIQRSCLCLCSSSGPSPCTGGQHPYP